MKCLRRRSLWLEEETKNYFNFIFIILIYIYKRFVDFMANDVGQ